MAYTAIHAHHFIKRRITKPMWSDITSYTTGGEAVATTLAKSFPNAVLLGMTGYASLEGEVCHPCLGQSQRQNHGIQRDDGAQVTTSTDLGEWTVSFLGGGSNGPYTLQYS